MKSTFRPEFDGFVLAGKADFFADMFEACQFSLEQFPESFSIPGEGDPLRIHLEGMPCLASRPGSAPVFQLSGREAEIAAFQERYASIDVDSFSIRRENDTGLYALAEESRRQPRPGLRLLHFSLRGPYTFALTARDEEGSAAFYNPVALDLIVKQLSMKIRWRERKLKGLFPGIPTMVVLGEPSLSVFTSAHGAGSWSSIRDAIGEVLSAVEGIGCLHCCSNFDWPLLMEMPQVDCINFDACQHGGSMSLYPDAVQRFLSKGGTIAWGIVPTTAIDSADPQALADLLERHISALVAKGVDRSALAEASWITPSCAPGTLSRNQVARVYEVTREVSARMKARYSA